MEKIKPRGGRLFDIDRTLEMLKKVIEVLTAIKEKTSHKSEV